MTETKTKPDMPDLSGETETRPTETEPIFKIESPQDLFELICVLNGVDPNQVQSMAKFSDFNNVDERSYYPNQITAVAIAQLRMYGEALYRGHSWDPYTLCANLLGVGFMGYKGFKSGQYVDITSGQPNLDKLRDLAPEIQQGLLRGLLNRGPKE